MKLRKLFIGLLVLSSMLVMVACNDPAEQPHEHTYETEWNKDLTNHWHDAACGHDEIKDKAAHTWGEAVVTLEPTEEANGLKTYTCTVCGQTKEELIDVLPHTHKYSSEWDKDATHHWHNPTCDDTEELKDKAEHTWNEGEVTKAATCAEKGEMTYTCTVCEGTKVEEIAKATEHIEGEETEVVYVAGYAVTQYVTCKTEVSREACFTYTHTYRDAELEQTVTEILPVELVDGVYSFEFTTPQWGRIVMNLGDTTISSSEVTMLNGKGWNGGAFASAYPLYHDGDTVTFLSAIGGTYPVKYNPTTNELLLGKPVLPLPENGLNVQKLNGDSGLTVWTEAGTVIRATDGTYPALPGQWTPWRLYVAVDAEGRIAYLCLYIPNGYGGATGTTYIRHSEYADYTTNPALTVDDNGWGLVVPEGGFVITAHSGDATALLQAILQNDSIEANDDNQAAVNTNANDVDHMRLVFDAENEWVLINEEVPAPVLPDPISYTINKSMPTGLTYITNNAGYPDPEYYGDGGLKFRFANQGASTAAFTAVNKVNVTVNIKGLYENTKSGNGAAVFTVYGLDAEGNTVVTASLDSVVVGDNSVVLEGEGIVSVKVIFSNYAHNGNKFCNVSLGGVALSFE